MGEMIEQKLVRVSVEVRVVFPIEPEGFFVQEPVDPAGIAGSVQAHKEVT